MPSAPPSVASTVVSRMAMRSISPRLAPSAAATAICCRLPTARASSRLVMLTQPTSSSPATAASKIRSGF